MLKDLSEPSRRKKFTSTTMRNPRSEHPYWTVHHTSVSSQTPTFGIGVSNTCRICAKKLVLTSLIFGLNKRWHFKESMKKSVLLKIVLGVWLISFPVLHAAEMRTAGDRIFVETDAYEVEFEKGVLVQLHNKYTAETYTIPEGPGGRTGILWKDGKHTWTRYPTVTTIIQKTAPLKATLIFRQGTSNEMRMFLTVESETGDLLIEQIGLSKKEDLSGIQWACGNLDKSRLDIILPAKNGLVFTDTTHLTTGSSFTYPGRWEAQLAILDSPLGGFYVRSTDVTYRFKSCHINQDVDTFAVKFRTQNQAPFDGKTRVESVKWRLNVYRGDWPRPAQLYRDWMEKAFRPRRLRDMPAWIRDLRLVVIYSRLEIELLDTLATQIDPTQTLLYLVGWRRYAHDENYPDYTPKPEFEGFVHAAHRHGFRVMLHVNLVGVSPYHPLYAEFQKFQMRDPWSGRHLGWYWEDIANPVRFAYINLASSQFRNYLVRQLKAIWEKYHVDAFHLDVSHFVVNDANGPIEGITAAQGNALMHQELAQAMPRVALSGEGLNEVTFLRESFAQHGTLPLEVKHHPISRFLFLPYTLPYGHLGLSNPDTDPLTFQQFIDSYKHWEGILPTFRLRRVDQVTSPRTQTFLALARTWEPTWNFWERLDMAFSFNFDLAADVNADGSVNILDLVSVTRSMDGYVENQGADVNKDGQVNVLDLVLVAQAIGEQLQR